MSAIYVYIRVEQIWVNGPVRKIISNRSRPILKILKNCHWINCKLQFKMYPILFAVIICHMLFIPIIIKLHTQDG